MTIISHKKSRRKHRYLVQYEDEPGSWRDWNSYRFKFRAVNEAREIEDWGIVYKARVIDTKLPSR